MNRTNQKIKKKEGKGITLIALVITIIVLLILAAVSIATLTGDEGILNQTGKAEDENSRASAEEQVKLAVAGSYGKNGKLDYKELKDNLNKITGIDGVPDEITDDSFPITVKVNGYEVTINANGTVESKKEESTGKIKWEQDEITITMTDGEGTETKIGVGDVILNYNPKIDETGIDISSKTETSNGTENGYGDQIFNNNYTGGWKVLGVDKASGQLMITTDSVIQTSTSSNFYLNGGKGYVNGIQELDKISKLYSQGKYADKEKTRSVNVDDINRITGYNPEKTGDGNIYGKDKIFQYNNEVTYSWDGAKVKYASAVANGTSDETTFQYLDENGSPVDLGKGESKSFTCNMYNYYPNSLTESSSGTSGKVQSGTNAYSLLKINKDYWLGSQFVSTNKKYVCFGVRVVVTSGDVYGYWLFHSNLHGQSFSFGVRPAVYLKSDIKLTGDSSDGWTIQ